MAGPTPTSALIHAATMVTAGVYLIARTHVLFTLAPQVQFAVAIIGAATMLLAAFSALAQRDMKRVLAYSTISQIGYMFLALGLGAWSAAMFHFMTHAFFKALLFLAAGVVIHAIHEQDLFKMGGLRTELRLAFWSFVIGGSALAGLPLITAGFFSKDLILWQSWAGPNGSAWFWIAGHDRSAPYVALHIPHDLARLLRPSTGTCACDSGVPVRIALISAMRLSILGGYVDTPPDYGGVPALSNFLNSVLPPLAVVHSVRLPKPSPHSGQHSVRVGLGLAYLLFGPQRTRTDERLPCRSYGSQAGASTGSMIGCSFARSCGWPVRAEATWLTCRFEAWRDRHAWQPGLAPHTDRSVRWYAAGLAIGTVASSQSHSY